MLEVYSKSIVTLIISPILFNLKEKEPVKRIYQK